MTRLTGEIWQGSYAEAYVNAICWAAGFICTRPHLDSGHKIDFMVSAAGSDSTSKDPRVDIQVKSTYQDRLANGNSKFTFDKPLHDWARKPEQLLLAPRLVVLVQVPPDPADWMIQSDDELSSKHCAYWVSLRGQPEISAPQESLVVHFPSAQKFTVPSLIQLMQDTSEGRWP